MSQSQKIITLTANRWDARPQPFFVEDKEWQEAIALVEKRGYRPNTFSGLDRATVKPFLKELRLALAENDEATQLRLADLVHYLEGPGSLGFTMSRGFRRAC